MSVWCWFVSDDLWSTVVCCQPPSLFIRKVWVPVMRFCMCRIHCRVHWRVGRRSGLCRSTSALLLKGSTIREFSKTSALWVLEVLCCLYLCSSYLIDHSMFWWIDVAVNWSTLCQECRRAVFWARCCSFCTPRNFFPFWRIS